MKKEFKEEKQMDEKKPLETLYEGELDSGMVVSVWVDEGYVYTQIGFLTFSLPLEDFLSVVEILETIAKNSL